LLYLFTQQGEAVHPPLEATTTSDTPYSENRQKIKYKRARFESTRLIFSVDISSAAKPRQDGRKGLQEDARGQTTD
jgi:hypothetical protein